MRTARGYDDSDRLITVVENATGSGAAVRTTHYEYTDDGWLKKLKCDNSATGQQVTEWVYGVTTGGGSALNSNRLVREKYYPDTSGSGDCETFDYNRRQEVISKSDQNDTTHTLDYDKLGRLILDSADVDLGSGIDASVVALQFAYNERGLLKRCNSRNSSSVILNEVAREYNDFNQLVTEYQEHSGAVNTSTSRKVEYTFADGSANTLRPTGIVYPYGTVISTAYDSVQADFLSRPDQVVEGSTVIASIRYLGLGIQIGLKYDAAADTELTYENGSPSGDAGDKYTGFDRFGRLVETIWKNSSGDLVHSNYGRNRFGGVGWRRDDVAHSITPAVLPQDTFYQYDALRQVWEAQQGELDPSTGPPYTGTDPATMQQYESFGYDSTGNWEINQSLVPSMYQVRTQTRANEIDSISDPSGVVQPTYDAVGNMTTMPTVSDWTLAHDCVWDAWNRLVKIQSGSVTVQACTYDAFARRLTHETFSPAELRDYYYNRDWRCVEEQVSGSPMAQYNWHPLDRWALIRRKRSSGSTLNEHLYCLRDYIDPVAVIDAFGTVQERYGYSAFGKARIMDDQFTDIGASPLEWSWLFHGEFRDLNSWLYNYGYRFYHTSLGRWLSRDPIGEVGGGNLYQFAGNNSTSFLDYLGLELTPPPGMTPGNEVAPPSGMKRGDDPFADPKPPRPRRPFINWEDRWWPDSSSGETLGPDGGNNDGKPPEEDRGEERKEKPCCADSGNPTQQQMPASDYPCKDPHKIRDPQEVFNCSKALDECGKRAAGAAGRTGAFGKLWGFVEGLWNLADELKKCNKDFQECMKKVPCICPKSAKWDPPTE